ncbi:MAG: YfhO family protein [Bacteroidales bacterium]|nr:YfhO family protein [Bacteroidales bacterium]
MNKKTSKRLLPYILALIVFLGFTIAYFSPLFEGQQMKQHDITMYLGMSKEINTFRAQTGEEPLWTNSMFGGMPAWQISVVYSANLMRDLDKVLTLGLPSPADYVFLYFLGFFVLLLVMKVDPWLSIVGAIAFGLSSYFFIILGVGHTSKAHAIAYMAPVLAGMIWTFRGKYLRGGLLTAVALSLEILAGHLQITYYLLMLVLVYGVYRLYVGLKDKQMTVFAKASGVLILAATFAILTNITSLWGTYQYSKYSMRGKPVLHTEQEVKSGGLNRDYITAWSYGIGETWSLMIPNVKGGASGMIGDNSALQDVPSQFRRIVAQQNAYWGDQPGTSGPVYVGAVIIFLFVLGMFVLDDRLKWVLLAATLLSVFLSWGKNMMWFTNLFIDYFPGYDKFRAVSMTLVIAELTIPLIAILGVNKILKQPDWLKKNMKKMYLALGLTAGVGVLFYLFPTVFFSFFSSYELQQFDQLKLHNDPNQVMAFINSLEGVRVAIFRKDVLRSVFFIVLGALLVYLFVRGKLKKSWFILLLGVLILVDMTGIDQRYLNHSNYEPARKARNPFQLTIADQYIDKDQTLDNRVVDLTKNVFNDASTSYFHESIGGYHGAKLQRYQDMIDHYLLSEINSLRKVLSSKPSMETVDSALQKQVGLNMLNTRFLIYNPNAQPIYNTYAYGNAWLVNDYQLMNSPDSIIAALGKTDLKSVAVVSNKFAGQLEGKKFPVDASASIKLASYAPNKLVYDFSAKAPQLAVFSEIYYPKGWEVFLDGKKVPYFRADYLLRAMVVPAGKHQIVFKFKPEAWVVGEKISLVASLILLLFTAVFLFKEIMKLFKKEKQSK